MAQTDPGVDVSKGRITVSVPLHDLVPVEPGGFAGRAAGDGEIVIFAATGRAAPGAAGGVHQNVTL